MRVFLSIGLTEHTGHGIPTIVKMYGEEVFEIEDNYIRCTIPFDEEVLNKLKNENVGLNVGLNKTEKKVVSLLIEDSEYTSLHIIRFLEILSYGSKHWKIRSKPMKC